MPIEKCAETFMEKFSFWEHLTDGQKKEACENTSLMSYKKGTNIHSAGDKCLGVILVKTGQLRVYMLSEDGRDITLYRIFAGETCILAASCVLDAITFDVFIDAEENSDVLVINAGTFRRLSDENIYVEAYGYKLATIRFSDVMWAMQQILFMGVDKRLAIFLIDESSKRESDDIPLTHEQIARYMGTAREVVSRMLKYFSAEGIVSLYRGGIRIIDKKRLQKIL